MELALKIHDVIRQYQQEHSGVRPREVRQALRMAELSTGTAPPRMLILGLVAVILAAGLALALFMPKGPVSAGGQDVMAFPFVVLGILVAVFLVMVILRRR